MGKDFIDDLPTVQREALLEALGRARHDIGKYVSFQARWLPSGAPVEDLREALQADLAATRRSADRVESAPDLWSRFRPSFTGQMPLPEGVLVDLGEDPDLLAIDAAMAEIEALIPVLGEAPARRLQAGAAAARRVAEALRRLHARVGGR